MSEKQNVIPPGLTRLAVELRGPNAWSLAKHEIHDVVRYTAHTAFTKHRQYRLSDGKEVGGKGSARPVTEADERREVLRRARVLADRKMFELSDTIAQARHYAALEKITDKDVILALADAATAATSTLKSLLASKDGAG